MCWLQSEAGRCWRQFAQSGRTDHYSPSGLLEVRGGAASCGLYSAPATPLLPREVLPSLLSALSPNPIVSVLEQAGSCLAACLRILKSPVPVVQELTLRL